MKICSEIIPALTTLSCHADMFRAVGPLGLVLYVPLGIPIGLAMVAIGYAFPRQRRNSYRYDRVSARDIRNHRR